MPINIMGIKATRSFFIVSVLIFILATSLSGETELNSSDTPLTTRIVSMSYDDMSGDGTFTSFQFSAEVEISNEQSTAVVIEHPDTCEFIVTIRTIKTDSTNSVSNSLGCGDAITPVSYESGIKQTTKSVVFSASGDHSTFPEGTYELSYGNPLNNQYKGLVSFAKTIMTVNSEGMKFQYDAKIDQAGTESKGTTTTLDRTAESAGSDTKTQGSSYIVTTDENGQSTTIFASEQTSTIDQKEQSTTNDGGDRPETVEPANFNVAPLAISILFVAITIARKRRMS